MATEKELASLIAENESLKQSLLTEWLFYTETIKLFGESTTTLAAGLKKARALIHEQCEAKARAILAGQSPRQKSSFNAEAFMKHCEVKTKQAFSGKYPFLQIVHRDYYSLIRENDPRTAETEKIYGMYREPMSKEDALIYLIQKYNYPGTLPSFVRLLEKHHIPDLPPRRTLENREQE